MSECTAIWLLLVVDALVDVGIAGTISMTYILTKRHRLLHLLVSLCQKKLFILLADRSLPKMDLMYGLIGSNDFPFVCTQVQMILAGRSSTQPNGKHKEDSGRACKAGD